jgi:hypothetical protein
MLRFINVFFLQWFFIRLTLCQQNIIVGAELDSVSVLNDGSHGFAFRYAGIKVQYWYSIQGWVVPLTGWKNDFRYVGKKWMKALTDPF